MVNGQLEDLHPWWHNSMMASLCSVLTEKAECPLYLQSQVIFIVSLAIHQVLILMWDLHDTPNSRRHWLDSLCSVLVEKAEAPLYLQFQAMLIVSWAIHQVLILMWISMTLPIPEDIDWTPCALFLLKEQRLRFTSNLRQCWLSLRLSISFSF